jgi:uncharacterized cupredoxin-like copper-binding protein
MRIIAIFGLALLPTFAWAGTGEPGHKHKTFSAGTPGDPSKPARTVEVTMREADGSMSFAPDRIEVRHGEQIKFALTNAGTQDHEFMLATKEENATHGKLMERFPEMEHDDPNGKRLAPQTSSDIIWKFTKKGTFEFACLIPGPPRSEESPTLQIFYCTSNYSHPSPAGPCRQPPACGDEPVQIFARAAVSARSPRMRG